MIPFPILYLPQVPFDQLYQLFSVTELILLSQCSKRVRAIIRSMNTRKHEANVSVLVEQRYSRVSVYFPKTRRHFSWSLILKRPSQLAESKGFVDRRIDGVIWGVANNEETDGLFDSEEAWESDTRQGCFEEDTLAMVNAIRNIFNVRIASLCLIFRNDTDFDKLLVATDTFHRARKIVIGQCALTTGEMTHLLDHLVTEELKMYGYAGRDFVYEKPIKIGRINIEWARWVDFETLKRLADNNRVVRLAFAERITNAHLNQFIKSWMSGNHSGLEMLLLANVRMRGIQKEPLHPFVRDEILDGLETLPGEAKRMDAGKTFQQRYDYTKGVDIRRADGVLASVIVTTTKQFFFTVWKDEDPNG